MLYLMLPVKFGFFWKDFVRVDIIGNFNQVMYCNIGSSNLQCFASFVYDISSLYTRKILWDQKIQFHSICNLPWLVKGDFNTIGNPFERIGGSLPIYHSMVDFSSMIMDYNHIDIGLYVIILFGIVGIYGKD
ncbi:hypothetical protein KFK09_001818 [Dendrobium nobile]|uniref:Uncharacterized protein n=1 Tax=Dendrobium nobile TaxID=94219 RepID=A0A8T3CBC4_DENNO|nr:hypothetical protein KFK09_001818 [Dendrobium nobile]